MPAHPASDAVSDPATWTGLAAELAARLRWKPLARYFARADPARAVEKWAERRFRRRKRELAECPFDGCDGCRASKDAALIAWMCLSLNPAARAAAAEAVRAALGEG